MAHEAPAKAATTYHLPLNVTGPADVARLGRELESLDNYMQQAALRSGGKPVKLPKTTRAFDDMAALNGLDMSKPADRQRLGSVLGVLKAKAPVLHISFSVEPSSAFVGKLVTWLRENISPFVLVQIGKQPTIGGGCVVRTVNRQFDFSFRQYLLANRGLLSDALARAAAK